MNHARRIIFYLFLVAYLIICPFTLLYAFGVTFSPAEEAGIVRTGAVTFSSIPKNADIYLDRLRYHQKTPAAITDLKPGDYTVRLVSKQFQSWERSVRIEPGKAVLLEDVWLRPRWPEITHYASLEVERIASMGRYTLLMQSNRVDALSVLRKPDDLPVAIASADLLAESDAVIAQYWVGEQTPQLIISTRHFLQARYWWMNWQSDAAQWFEITHLIGNEPREFIFDPHKAGVIWSVHKTGVDRIDVEKERAAPESIVQPAGWGMDAANVYWMTADGYVWQAVEQGKLLEPVFDQPVPDAVRRFAPLRLYPSNERWLAWDRRGNVFYFNPKRAKLIAEGVRDIQSLKPGGALLLRTRTGLGLVKSRDVRWIYEHPLELKQAQLAADERYILFADNRQLFLLQLWRSGVAEAVQLAHIKAGSAFVWDEAYNRVLYIDDSGVLCSFNLFDEPFEGLVQ